MVDMPFPIRLPLSLKILIPLGCGAAILIVALVLTLGKGPLALDASPAPAAAGVAGAIPAASASPADSAGPAGSASPAGSVETRQTAWVSQCQSGGRSEALDCSVVTRLGVASTGQPLVVLTVRVPSDTRQPVMLIQVPLGLSLSSGIAVSVDDGSPETYPLQTCDTNGCYAGAPLPQKLLAAMTKGKTLTLVLQNINKEQISLALALDGFPATFDRIK